MDAFQNAAEGLMSIILDLTAIEPKEVREVTITGEDPDQLLVKWLSEILYLYDGQGFVCRDFLIVNLNSKKLRAVVRGESFSRKKHRTKLDVKAVTYHQLSVQENQHGAVVRVFFDI